MAYLIGMDEAGYGPNLGPLVLAASVWHIPGHRSNVDLYTRLAKAVLPQTLAGDSRLTLADSKMLYKPGAGIARLEQNLLPCVAQTDRLPDDWQQMLELLRADPDGRRNRLPWYQDFQMPLPWQADQATVQASSDRLTCALQHAKVRLVDLQARVYFPEQFNAWVEATGSKGVVLSQRTLELLASVLSPLGHEPIHVVCDKHGGRNRYQPLLQAVFPDRWIEIRSESRPRSVYRFDRDGQSVEINFRVGGESFLPAALASMGAKYLRELCMLAFNRFWAAKIGDLKPTAGYPVDARRFRAEVCSIQHELGIEDRIFWRNR